LRSWAGVPDSDFATADAGADWGAGAKVTFREKLA
jgi:hypothetical protein